MDSAPDDSTLFDNSHRPLARIYRYRFGADAGRWAWFVLVAPDRERFIGERGLAETESEARELCERLLRRGGSGQRES